MENHTVAHITEVTTGYGLNQNLNKVYCMKKPGIMRTATYTQAMPRTGTGLSLFVIFSGFLPVLSIVLHCLGIISLQNALFTIILPAFTLSVLGCIRLPEIGKVVLIGWLAGILAVFLYDLSRVPFIMANVWGDFIPKIGGWINNTQEPDFFLGYLWRYIGNGGGMGAAFFLLMFHLNPSRKKVLAIGLLYGLFIFGCLMTVLLTFTEAQQMMFKITPMTFTGSLTGHIIYGLVLGSLYKKFSKE